MSIDTLARRSWSQLLPLLAAAGCVEPSLLGISAQVGAELTTAPPDHPTVITGQDNEYLTLRRPSVGDLDGDGLDDFVVEGLVQGDETGGMRAFLFYGRTDFPEQLMAADADAVIESGGLMALSLGDINGDGLSDLALGDWGSSEIIFGSSTRLRGRRARFSGGVMWTPANPFAATLYLWPLGDLDGDGMDELRASIFSNTPGLERGDASAAPSGGSLLDLGGDFDGDGSTDLIFGLVEDIGPMERRTFVQLVPGAPHAPD